MVAAWKEQMTWTDGRKHVPGALFNTYLRDALDFLSQRPGCKVRMVEEQTIPRSSWTGVRFEEGQAVVDWTQGGVFDQANPETFTAPRTGKYYVAESTVWTPSATGAQRAARLKVNDADSRVVPLGNYPPADSDLSASATFGAAMVTLQEGDSFGLELFYDRLDSAPDLRAMPRVTVRYLNSLSALGTWTTPRTWAHGELVNAAMLNVYLRDNMRFLEHGLGAKVYLRSDLSLATGVWTTVPWTAAGVAWDNGGLYVPGTNTERLVPGRAGKWLLGTCATFGFDNISSTHGIRLLFNNDTATTATLYEGPCPSLSADDAAAGGDKVGPILSGDQEFELTAADTVRLQVLQSTGGASSLIAGGPELHVGTYLYALWLGA